MKLCHANDKFMEFRDVPDLVYKTGEYLSVLTRVAIKEDSFKY